MRTELCGALVEFANDPTFLFFTGDLGFKAFEPLQNVSGNRFVNAGVAEQNMVAVAAGCAKSGFRPFVYSIAPFCFARPLEQIRNLVGLSQNAVRFIGNGGGYGYGSMGPTHHALEDCAVMATVPGMQILVPAFGQDVKYCINKMFHADTPSYLRLGVCELKDYFDPLPFQAWRNVLPGSGDVLVICGPLAGLYVNYLQGYRENDRPDVWVVSQLPIDGKEIPEKLLQKLSITGRLNTVEEHIQQGGISQQLTSVLAARGIAIRNLNAFFAKGYSEKRYGSQNFHRERDGLMPIDVLAELKNATSRKN